MGNSDEKIDIRTLLERFIIEEVKAGKAEIYNEFSLQHELGIFLRNNIPEGYKVEFERNIKYFDIDKNYEDEFGIKIVKHEIDIVIYNGNELYAVELKFPRNGQYPEQMYAFIKDIKFMEQLKDDKLKNKFNATFCLTMVDAPPFTTKGKSFDGIYGYFRYHDNKDDEPKEIPAEESIKKPTGNTDKDDGIILKNSYRVKWEDLEIEIKDSYTGDAKKKSCKYYIIEIKD